MTRELMDAAEAAAQSGRWEQALAAWREVRTASPDKPAGYIGEGRALISLRRFDEAEAVLGVGRERFPTDLWIAYDLAVVATRRGDAAEAVARWQAIQQLFPEAPEGFLGQAQALIEAGHLSEAEELLLETTGRFPENLWAAWQHAVVVTKKTDWDRALELWRSIRKRFPDHPQGSAGEGEILTILRRFDDAEQVLEFARSRFPNDVWVAHHYANAATQRRHWADAAERWSEVVVAFPGHTEGHQALVEAQRRCGDTKAATASLEAFEERFGHSTASAIARLELSLQSESAATSAEIWRGVPVAQANSRYFSMTCRLWLKWLDDDIAGEFLTTALQEPDDGAPEWRPALCELLFTLEVINFKLFKQARSQILRVLDAPHYPQTGVSTTSIVSVMLGVSDEIQTYELLYRILGQPRQSIICCMFHSRRDFDLTPILQRLVGDADAMSRFRTTPSFAFNLILLLSIFWPSSVGDLLQRYQSTAGTVYPQDAIETRAHAAMTEIALVTPSRMAPERDGPANTMLPRPAINAVAPRSRRVAVCISGQLRGYEQGWDSWRRAGLFPDDTRFFVHVWENIGRRTPEPSHLSRCFSGELLKAVARIVELYGIGEVGARFPRMLSAFRERNPVSRDHLQQVYGAAATVAIEDDATSAFMEFNNSAKMHYKIQNCFDIIPDLSEFQVIVRIRPDREIVSHQVDFDRVYHESIRNKLVYADWGRSLTELGYCIGDQFAMGAVEPMRVYSHAYAFTHRAIKEHLFAAPARFIAHSNLAFATLYGGVKVEETTTIHFGEFFDPPPPGPSVLLDLIEEDLATRAPDALDRAVLDGCRQDIGRG